MSYRHFNGLLGLLSWFFLTTWTNSSHGTVINLPCECEATTTVLTTEVTSVTTAFSDGAKGAIERIVAAHRGTMGVSLRNLDTGETIEVNAQTAFPTASTIKLAVMCKAMDALASGTGPFKDYYSTRVYDGSSSASGAGFIQRFQPGTAIELKELLHFMITVSDNTATNMLTEWLGGPAVVSDWLKAHGFKVTRMNATIGSRMIDDPGLRQMWGLGVTTPCEMRRLMEMIALGRAGTTSTTPEMLRLLGHQYFDDLVAATVPPTTWVGSKSGALNAQRADVALVNSPGGRYVLVVFTKDNVDKRWTSANEAEIAIRAVGTIVWNHFNPQTPYKPSAESAAF